MAATPTNPEALLGQMERRGLKPTFATGMVVLGLAAVMTVVMVAFGADRAEPPIQKVLD